MDSITDDQLLKALDKIAQKLEVLLELQTKALDNQARLLAEISCTLKTDLPKIAIASTRL